MTPLQLAQKCNFNILVEGEGNSRDINGIYCCDLLSIVMGKASLDNAWITVMGNINSIAVAVLADVSCIVLSENMKLDDNAKQKAIEEKVCVLTSDLPTFEIAIKIHENIS